MDHLSLDVAATPCLADMELALRRADAAGLIRYRTGDVDFEVLEDAPLSDAQRAALERMREPWLRPAAPVLRRCSTRWCSIPSNASWCIPCRTVAGGSTGTEGCFPTRSWCLGITAKAVAGRVHTDWKRASSVVSTGVRDAWSVPIIRLRTGRPENSRQDVIQWPGRS